MVRDPLVEAPRLGEGDRHVLENAGMGGMVAQRQPIRGQRGLVIALAFERERLVQIIGALGFELVTAQRRDYLNESLRSEEHTSELQSQSNLVCRLLLEKKKNAISATSTTSFLTC